MTEPAVSLVELAVGKAIALLILPKLLIAGVVGKPNVLASQATP